MMIFGFLSQNLKTQAVAVAFSIAWPGSEVEPLAEDDGQARDRLAAFRGSCTGALRRGRMRCSSWRMRCCARTGR